jgi:hypothetical protein
MKKTFLIACSMLICIASYAQPTLTTFAPTSGPIGSSVTLTGTGFNVASNQNIVFFGATQATVTAASTTSLTVTVPFGSTYQYISVTNLGVNLTAYSSKAFNVTFAGDVSFANKVDFATGSNARAIKIGDIDGDGKPDLVTTNYNSNTISVLRNTSTSGTVSFATRVDFPTVDPYALSIGDIDGDGKLDLAVVRGVNNTVSVFRNTSTSGMVNFATEVDFILNASPSSVTIGDIDADGKPDLVLTVSSHHKVSVLRNTSVLGFVSFAAGVDFGTGPNPASVSIGDIDGDKKPDLVVANGTSNQVSVLRNTSVLGFLSFAPKADFLANNSTRAVSIGDMDGDGKLDLAVAIYGSSYIEVLHNTSTLGNVNFASPIDFPTGSYSHAISMGDINGDGKPDLAVNGSSSPIAVLGNTSTLGSPYFGIRTDAAGAGADLSIGDLDGDGKPDLVAITGSTTISVYRQVRPIAITSFSPTSGPIGSSVTIKGKGFHAIPSQNVVFFGATQASVIATSGDTSLTVIVPLAATYKNISVTCLHVNLTAYTTQPFTVTLTGRMLFANKQDFTTGAQPNSVSIVDLDGDGQSDLVVENGNSNTISVFRNISIAGGVTFAPKVDFTTSTGPSSVSVGDINGDGKPDLVVVSLSGNKISIFPNTSVLGSINFAAKIDRSVGGNPNSVSIADLTGNGKLDLAMTRQSINAVSTISNYSLSGGINFIFNFNFTTGSAPSSVSIEDIDGDGKPDLVVTNYISNTVSVFRNITNNPTYPHFAPKVDFTTGTAPISVKIGDIDGDGKPDLAVANYNSDNVSIFHNTSTLGTVSFATRVDFATGTAPISVSIGDIDGDGKPDLAIANSNSNTVSTIRNTSTSGAVNFASKIDYATDITPYSVNIGDIDGDGKPDLAVANYNSNTVSVLRQIAPPSITSFSPSSGCVNSTSVVITGTDFTNTTAVTFGGVNALNFTIDSATQITATVAGSNTGTIEIVTGDGTGVSLDTFTINPLPTVSLGIDTIQCGGNIILDAANVGSTYLWSTADTTQTINVSSSNTYSVFVTDGNSCSNADTINVTIDSLPTVSLGADTIQCGGNIMLDATNAGSTYLWSTTDTTQIINVSSSNTYSVFVIDGNGCSNSDTINVTIDSLPTIYLGTDINQCEGSVTLDAANMGLTYLWSTSDTTQTINVSSSNTYSVLVTDGNNCYNADTITVTINPFPTVSLGTDITQCGGSVTLDAANIGLIYAWSTAQNTQTINVSSSNTYSVVVTDGNNCSSSDTINITIDSLPTIALGADITQCEGSVTLDAANAGSSYIWSTTDTSQTINVSSSNTYSVVVTDGNNCSNADTIDVTINSLPITTTTLNGATMTSDQTGATYQWIDCNNDTAIVGANNQDYTTTVNGSYAVAVTLNTCSDTSSCVNVTSIGITKIANSNAFSVYPNPFSTQTTLVASNVLNDATFIIYNAFGQQVKQMENIYGQTITFQRDHLTSGLYFIHLIQDRKTIAIKKLVLID